MLEEKGAGDVARIIQGFFLSQIMLGMKLQKTFVEK